MDLVKIGFQINANGLKDANTEVDKLLDKVDNIGTKGKKASSDFESSQKKVKDSTQQVTKEVDKTSKALEKQKIIGDYLGKGLDKTTATSIASFKQLGATVSQTNEYISNQLNNKGLEQTRKELTQLGKEQQKQQEQQAKLVQDTVAQYEKLSNKSFGGGILDSIEQQNKGIEELRKQYQEEIKEANKKADADQKILDDAEKERQKHFSKVQKDYEKQQQAIVDTQQKAIDKQVKAQNTLNESNQKAITLEQAKAKYVSQGYGKTDSTRLARLEVSGADVTTLNNYKSAIEATTRATQALNPAVEKVTTSHSNFLDQVKGIAIYAALSAAIYGVMTAMTNLAVATVKMADEYTSIQNRMKLYITDAKELGKVNSQLAQFSMENNVGLRETATLFSRLAPSMQKLGANTAAITTVVDAFGKSMRIGGATAMEAASATIQFSQAMASGKLAGDEFRSISEASPRFLQAIAEGSGIAADKLKEMSAAGMLTTEVISKALLKEYPKLIEENKKLGITLEQGANALKTGFLVAFGEFNEGAGITKALGESMANLAQSMLTAAQGARQFGADVKKWFKDNADTIQTVVDAFQLLATVIASRYVAAIVLARIETLKLTYQTSALAAAQTASMRSFVIGATVVTAFGRAAQTAFAFMGGLPGLALTVVGVAATYLLLRDNAAEANKKLEEQSVYLNKTTEDFKELNAEQMKNAQFKIKVDMEEANKNIEKAKNEYLNFLRTLATKPKMTGFDLNFIPRNNDAAELINSAEKGNKSFDAVTASIIEQGVATTEQNKKLLEFNDRYVKAATSGINMAKTAKAVGVDSEISGNKMQNAAIQAQLLGNGYSDVGDKAEIAGGKVRKFYQDLQADTQKNILAFDLSNKLNISPSTGNKVAEELSNRAAQEEGLKNKELINQYQKLVKLKADLLVQNAEFKKGAKSSGKLDQLKANTAEVLKQQRIYDNMRKSKPYVKVNPSSLLTPEETKIIKAYDASTSLSSNQTKADKEADKASDKLLKKREDVLASYQDQVDTVDRIQQLLAKGVGYEVAKVAASKDYYENITGTMLAEQVILAQQTQKRLEYLATLSEEEDIQTRAILLQQKGASYAQSRALAEAGFREDADGLLTLQKLMTNELYAQHYSLGDQLSWYTSINKMLKDGISLEEATTRATFSRLEATKKGLSDSEKSLMKLMIAQQKNLKDKETERQVTLTLTNAEKQRVAYVNAQAGGYANLIKNMAIANKIASDPTLSPSQAKALVEAEELTNYEKELAELKRQTYIATLNESDAVKTLVSNYSTMDSVQIGVLANQQRLLEIAKELAEEAEKQKNPLGDFSSVDFSVFGDFGNPFESALVGLNEFVAKSTESRNILASIEKDIVAAKEQGLSVNDLELERNIVLANQEKDRKKSIDKAITSGLALTKSLFKEESKGYKVVSGLEKAYQASKIAFALWEKKDTIKTLAIKVAGYAKDMITFIGGVTSKIAAQMGLNVVQAQGAVASAAQAPPPVGFASAAAMIALMAGIGIAISGGSGGEYVDTSNQGTGTVFGDSEAQSASIANSIDLLSENSDLMLPLTSAMLRSLKSIESNIGGLTNLVIRTGVGKDSNIAEGFQQNSTGKYLGMAGQLAGGVGGAIGGGLLGSFGAGLLGAGMGSALGIGLGVLTGGVGLLLGSALGSMLGGLFGTKTTIKASGLYGGDQKLGDILSEGFNLQEYVDIQTKKKTLGVTTSTKNKTKFAKADAELSNQFTLIFKGFYDSILSVTDILGADMSVVQNNLENAVVSIGKINLKGLNGEQIQEKLEAVFGAAADSLAKQAFGGLEDFQTVGEGYFETLVKVASAVEEAAYYTDRLNVTAINYTNIINKQADDLATEIIRQSYLTKVGISTIKGGMTDLVNSFDGSAEEITDFINTLEDLQEQLFMTGKSGDYLTSSMILGAGGLDSLASGLDAYFEMLSPAEQAAELTRRLTNEFAIFGKELPADVKAFRNLVSSIDITTEAGQKLYGQILALAPEFNDLQDALGSANSEVNALVQSLRDLAEQARAARGETEQPRNLAYTRSQFEQASVLAMQGDIASAEKLLTLGKDLMGLSKTYSVTGSEYARDLALIQRAATVSADIQEQGLGTSISTTLTPSSGSTTTPTIVTTNSTMTTELQGMREELNAGLFAIAKFVQNVDSRTERWDDGGRMMVGIQPENGDAPVPVVVTP